MATHKPDGTRPLTERQRNIETLQIAFEQFFPGLEPLRISYACTWLALADLGTILSVIEQAAERDRIAPLRSPTNYVYGRLNGGKRPQAQEHSTAIHFDANGQRCPA
jgi:hypothetical protein